MKVGYKGVYITRTCFPDVFQREITVNFMCYISQQFDMFQLINEPQRKKTGLRGFQPGLT